MACAGQIIAEIWPLARAAIPNTLRDPDWQTCMFADFWSAAGGQELMQQMHVEPVRSSEQTCGCEICKAPTAGSSKYEQAANAEEVLRRLL